METAGARIKRRRKELGWSQTALAQKASLSKAFLSTIEGDPRPTGGMSAETLLSVARCLGMTCDELATGSSNGAASNGEHTPQMRPAEIPALLAQLALHEDLSLRQTVCLIRVNEVIVDSSRGRKGHEPDWRKLYEALREFIE